VVLKTKIKEIKPKMRNIEVIARVAKIEFIPVASKKIAKATLEDDTGSIILNLWGPQVDQAKVGEHVKVREAYVKIQGKRMELNTWQKVEAQKP